MAGIARFELALWGLVTLLHVILVVYLLASTKWRQYPGLCFYLVVNLLQAVLLYYYYATWGFDSVRTKHAAWISQVPVLCMRAWALVDLCRLLLRPYSGIW